MVQTQDSATFPAKDGRPAQTAFNLVCVDMSQPPEARMAENISYRLKDEEVSKYWGKAMDKVIEVVCKRIAHSKAGKAILIGEIIPAAAAAVK